MYMSSSSSSGLSNVLLPTTATSHSYGPPQSRMVPPSRETSYASRVAPSARTSSAQGMYQHDMMSMHQQHQTHYEPEHQSRTPSPEPSHGVHHGATTQVYPSPTISSGFDFMHQHHAFTASHQNPSSSTSANHSCGSGSSQSAVHPVKSEVSWGTIGEYAANATSGSTASPVMPAVHSHQAHHHDLGAAPSMGGGFQSAMFGMDDDFTDAKILREVLQDQQSHHSQQHNHHHQQQSTSEMMSSNQHRYSYPHSSHQQTLTSTGFHFDSMGSYSMMAADSGASKSSIYMSPDTLAQIRTQSLGHGGMGRSSFRDGAAVSPSSSSYVSSAADSPLGTSSSASCTSSLIKKPASRICRVHGCTKGIRSRGLCKGHGGGRRCQTPGCEISDQGGGHCIAHGGGKRCNVLGCQKSAQSKGLCKLHGGARRCKVANCAKNCQIKGLCRLHYSMYANASSTDSVV
ncbi:hypothetical protein FI667_g16603, partial [Globisporangium splendens]